MAKGNARDIKRRIKSVTNTKKITRALQTVSAVKMRKAQTRTIATRPFAEESLTLLRRLSGVTISKHPLLKKKSTGKQLVILISPDKGLTGGLFSNLTRKVSDLVAKQQREKNRETDFITIGSQAEKFVRAAGFNLVRAQKNGIVDVQLARRMRDEIVTHYIKGPYDKIIVAYTQFVSTLRQKPFIRGILPITLEKIVDVEELPQELLTKPVAFDSAAYELEPSPTLVVDKLIPDLVSMLLYHALLEAEASEHSARMIAMKNAHDNASELIGDLTQTFNRLRQESITAALAEISAGVAALEK
ncbi:MAG: ATP synthase F1 subunit gamma [Candidatus Andersenbacteria bacterium]